MQVSTQPTILANDLNTLFKYVIRHHGTDFFEMVGEAGLSFTQVRALSLLARDVERATLGELGERLGLSLPAISRAVEGLVKRGYV
ncbi:MAG: hypothetical protein QOG86_959, partial [Thermoleophilaceae bacterium]|nr:hypothetical protein [Thermoleophilaceae bacterium]